MMLFAIVFGLSMDYEVFLLSRIKEEYDITGNNAYRRFARSRQYCGDHGRGRDHDLRVRQLRALGPAGAEAGRFRARGRGVHRRATVVRMVLVPNDEPLGDRNWAVPEGARAAPKVHIEGDREEAERELIPEPRPAG